MVEVYPNRPLALLHDVPFESFAYQTFKSFFLYTVLFLSFFLYTTGKYNVYAASVLYLKVETSSGYRDGNLCLTSRITSVPVNITLGWGTHLKTLN